MKAALPLLIFLALSGAGLSRSPVNLSCGYSNGCCGGGYVAGCTETSKRIVVEETKCEAGFTLENGRCVKAISLTCPPGSVFQNGNCMKQTSTPPTCPPNSVLNAIGKCEVAVNAVCLYGSEMVNGQCITLTPVPLTCPPNTIQRGNECVTINCPMGHRMENGLCIKIAVDFPIRPPPPPRICQYPCQTGITTDCCEPPVSQCINPPCTIAPPQPFICPMGTQYQNGACIRASRLIMVEETKCEAGFTLEGGRCVKVVSVNCPPGSIFQNGQCMKETSVPPTCPPGSVLNAFGKCEVTIDAVCPYGSNMVNGQCTRIIPVPVTCPPNTIQRGSECITIDCPMGHRMENGICIKIAVEPPINPPPLPRVCQYPCQTGITTECCDPPVNQCINPPCTINAQPQIVCPMGTQYQNGACIQQNSTPCMTGQCTTSSNAYNVCPPSTYWNGVSCSTGTAGVSRLTNVIGSGYGFGYSH